MSLELASFIKDLVAGNPLGSDPKSQGDDHLRLIKSVLQSQFSGFTEGIPITLTESVVNNLVQGGLKNDVVPAGNIDTGFLGKTQFVGITTGTTGTFPVGWAVGDVMLTVAYSATNSLQLYMGANSQLWYRTIAGSTVGPWHSALSNGAAQTWQNVGASRTFGTVYQNLTGRPIMVVVSAQTGASVQNRMEATVAGVNAGRASTSNYNGVNYSPIENCLSFIVPAGAFYSVTVLTTTSLIAWSELR